MYRQIIEQDLIVRRAKDRRSLCSREVYRVWWNPAVEAL